MSTFVMYTLLSAFAISSVFADTTEFANRETDPNKELKHSVLIPTEIQLPGMDSPSTFDGEKKVARKSPVVKTLFSPFTGKIVGDKVRMRLQPDLSSQVASELTKGEVVSVLAQEGDFYKIQPPQSFKTYVFRSFIIDNVVEGNRVNVRLGPDLDSTVVGYLNAGDRVEPIEMEASSHKKWLAIVPPPNASFYIAKNFVENIGDLTVRASLEEGKSSSKALSEAENVATSELAKSFEQINFSLVKESYEKVKRDFPQLEEQAKIALAKAEQLYTKKKNSAPQRKEESSHAEQENKTVSLSPLSHWKSVEQALYASWAEAHDQKESQEFYEQERLAAVKITGVLEAIKTSLKDRPGDFVIKHNSLPVGYVYSTNLKLEDYVGKQVTLLVSPRPNQSFAFPAYYVHQID